MESTLPGFDLTVLLGAAGLLATGMLAGWGAARFFRWWRRDEMELNQDFARLYSEGIAHYIAGRRDEAIDELTRAARLRTDVIALYLILGDLYRSKGLFDRAIRVHRGLLGRQTLSRAERAQVHASLGEDYKTAGMVERARESFEQALELDSRNLPALLAMSRFCIEEKQWEKAQDLEERILRLDRTRSSRPLAFIYNEIGREHLREGNERLAMRNFQKSVAVDDRTAPAHIFLGDLFYKDGKLRKAVEHWQRVVDLEPRQLHLVFDRLDNAWAETGRSGDLEDLCRRVSERDQSDWRARVLQARIAAGKSDYESAYDHLLEAATVYPESLTVQQELWKLTLARGLERDRIRKYLELVGGVNEFADPFVCSRCRYRSLEYLWRCPRCFEWESFAEEGTRTELR